MTGISENGKDVSLGYDINNRLTIYGETEYTYDVEGNLIKEKTGNTETTYVYDTTFGVPRVLVSTTGDQKTYYVYGNDLINEETGNSRKYYHYDLNGNTVSLTDESGNVTDTYRYESFGKSEHVKGTSDTPFKYAATSGVMTNKNGLMYMYTRYYDSCYDPEKRTTINDCFNYYYNSGSCKIRYNVFIDNIFSMDESYSSYASDIDHYELYTSGKYSDEKYKMQMCDLFTEYVYNYTKEYHSSGVKWSLYYNAPVTEKVAKGAAKGFSEYIISKWS